VAASCGPEAKMYGAAGDDGNLYILFPQMSMQWKPMQPNDNRAEVADLGVEIFSLNHRAPYFMNFYHKLRVRTEAKQSSMYLML
jgi:hypothetical protein